MGDCVFCRIASGAIPSERLYDDGEVLAIRDINPQAPTHILIMPRRHVASMLDVGEADAVMIGRIAAVAAQLARREGLEDRGFRLLTNTGPEGGQAVPHLHFHLLGGRQMEWPPG